jgi:tocopherol O-methyltransferase
MIIPTTVVDSPAVASHYDDLDPFYRKIWGFDVHHGYWITGKESVEEAVLNLTHLIAKQACMNTGSRVCDIGCGYGAADLIFAQDYGASVTGITVSTKQFSVASALSSSRGELKFLLCDALANGLETESFDCVIAIESSEHMDDKPRFFAEAMRLLRPGGRVVVAAWLSRERPFALETKYLLEPICRESRLPSLGSASEYQEMLARAGFHNIAARDLTRNVQRTWSICALRFVTKLFREPALRERFFAPGFSNRVFAKAVPRIWLAYQLGSMRYGLFSAENRLTPEEGN